MVILVLIAYILIGAIELVPLISQKETKKIWVLSLFFLFSFLTSLLLSLDVKIPSPAEPIENLVRAVIS